MIYGFYSLTLMTAMSVLTTDLYAKCFVGIPDDCPNGQVCAKFNAAGETKCFEKEKLAPIIFDLPFDARASVRCTQSGRHSKATHTWHNMLHAIDLATPYDQPPSPVFASAPGKAFVFAECPDPKGTPEQTKVDNCGVGYGNHVKILHEGGWVSLYAHLSKVHVKSGTTIQRGQKIGLEGSTGQAAYRHLHWDVHRMEGKSWESDLAKVAWLGVSVPFQFRVAINGNKKLIRSDELACRWLDMDQAPWSGTYVGQ